MSGSNVCQKHSFVHKLLDLKPGDISFLYFALQFLCSAIFEQQKNHPKEPLGILSRRAILLVIYNGIWNGVQISVLLLWCKKWLFHTSC